MRQLKEISKFGLKKRGFRGHIMVTDHLKSCPTGPTRILERKKFLMNETHEMGLWAQLLLHLWNEWPGREGRPGGLNQFSGSEVSGTKEVGGAKADGARNKRTKNERARVYFENKCQFMAPCHGS